MGMRRGIRRNGWQKEGEREAERERDFYTFCEEKRSGLRGKESDREGDRAGKGWWRGEGGREEDGKDSLVERNGERKRRRAERKGNRKEKLEESGNWEKERGEERSRWEEERGRKKVKKELFTII
jgi:hypothetical protein